MGDLIAAVRAAIDEAEQAARDAEPGPWIVGPRWGARETRVYVQAEGAFDWIGTVHGEARPDPDHFTADRQIIACQVSNKGRWANANAAHIARQDPAAVLRRCAADRKILDLHEVRVSEVPGFPTEYACAICDNDNYDGPSYGPEPACETVLALAEAYGVSDTASDLT